MAQLSSELPVTKQMHWGYRTRPRGRCGLGSPFLPTCAISVKETVLLAVVTEKGGTWTGGSPSTIFPVRMKGWCPVTSKEYATRAAKETTRALRARTEGDSSVRLGCSGYGSRRPHPATASYTPASDAAQIQATVWPA